MTEKTSLDVVTGNVFRDGGLAMVLITVGMVVMKTMLHVRFLLQACRELIC